MAVWNRETVFPTFCSALTLLPFVGNDFNEFCKLQKAAKILIRQLADCENGNENHKNNYVCVVCNRHHSRVLLNTIELMKKKRLFFWRKLLFFFTFLLLLHLKQQIWMRLHIKFIVKCPSLFHSFHNSIYFIQSNVHRADIYRKWNFSNFHFYCSVLVPSIRYCSVVHCQNEAKHALSSKLAYYSAAVNSFRWTFMYGDSRFLLYENQFSLFHVSETLFH